MNKKIKFEDAMEAAFDIKSTMIAEFHNNDYGISHHEMISLFMLIRKWGGEAKLSSIKEDINKNHFLNRTKNGKQTCNTKEFKRIEVMVSKTFSALEDAGFLQRIKNVNDKRETTIVVTEEGKKIVQKFLKNAQARWES